MSDTLTTQSATPATIPANSVIATDDAGAAGHVQIVKLAGATDGDATVISPATSGKQDTLQTAVDEINTKTPSLGQAVAGSSVPVVLPASQITTLTPPAAITGFATSAKQDTAQTTLDSLNTKLPSQGQALAAASLPVVLTAAQISTLTPLATVAVTQSGTWDEIGINDSGNSITVDSTQLPAALAAGGGLKVEGVAGGVTIPVTEASAASALTSLQLIDDTVYTDDTSTHSTGSSKGLLLMAAATPTDTSVNANDIGAVAMTTDRRLHVSVQDSLPAGTAAIGKLAANSGVDIGDVDVTSVPTDPFGANADAASATGSISAKLRFIASTGIPVTGTVTVGSHAVTNAGTFAVQDSEKIADNAGFTDGTTKVLPAGFIYDEVAGTALTENDAAAARINVNRAQVATIEDGSTRGRYATVSAANALKVDGSAVTQPVSGTVTATVGVKATLWQGAPVSRSTVLTTELNSLANAAFSAVGTAIDNTSNSDQYGACDIVLGSLNPTAGASLSLFLVQSLDGTTYEDAPSSTNPGAHMLVATVLVTTGSAAKRIMTPWFAIPPGKFKFVLLNNTNVTLAASGNTVTLYTDNDEAQ